MAFFSGVFGIDGIFLGIDGILQGFPGVSDGGRNLGRPEESWRCRVESSDIFCFVKYGFLVG